MTDDSSTILLTYAELADRLSIKSASAKRLAQRRNWHRVIGNDRIARVHVPLSYVARDVTDDIARDVTDDVSSFVPDDLSPSVISELSARVAYLEGVVEGLRGQLEAEQKCAAAKKQRAEVAEARVEDIAADREAWRRQAQRSIWSRLFGSD